MNNLRFYEAGRSVPLEAQKAFNNGRFSGTDINPMWRIKKLTEMFGPAGIGWYTDILSERSERLTEDTVIAIVDLNLYIRDGGEWSKPIYGTGGNLLLSTGKKGVTPSDEGYKMAYTDALSVACKALGIGADVYFEKDKSKYTQGQQPGTKPEKSAVKPQTAAPAKPQMATPAKPQMATPNQIQFIANNASADQLEAVMNAYGMECEKMTYAQAARLVQKLGG